MVAARAAGLAPPPQSVHPDIRDLDGLAALLRPRPRPGLPGPGGASTPASSRSSSAAYLPTAEEIEAARGDRRGGGRRSAGALALPDGRFVDAAVVAAAQRTLALAERRR